MLELDELLKQTHEPFKYTGIGEESMHKPILVLHSSGSTGTTFSNLVFSSFLHFIYTIARHGPRVHNVVQDPCTYVLNQTRLRLASGIPKPITMTHGTFTMFDYGRNLPTIPGRRNNDFTIWDSLTTRKFYSAFPPSHLGGFLSMIIIPIFSKLLVLYSVHP